MRLPWISRSAHEAIVRLLKDQAEELRQERKLLLDRLGMLGLGGPIFAKETAVTEEARESEPELVDPAREIKELFRLRRRPNQLADALRRKAFRDYNRRGLQPKVEWAPAAKPASWVDDALDRAEEAGRKAMAQ